MNLRRERRHKFIVILSAFSDRLSQAEIEATAELLSDASISDTEHKTDESRTTYHVQGITNKIYAGLPVEQSDLDQESQEKEVLEAFQVALQTPMNWQWYPAKTTLEKTWRDFRSYLVKLYTEDRKCFEKYQTWRNTPYMKGTMSNLAIKKNPENFPASWSDFCAGSAMYSKGDGERSSMLRTL